MTEEKILIGVTREFEVKDEIYASLANLRNSLSGSGSSVTSPVLRFALLEELSDIFESGGNKVLQRYEQSLKNQLAMLKKPIEIFNFEKNYPYAIKDFKTGLHHIKQSYDVVVSHLPKDALTFKEHIHEGVKIGFLVDVDNKMFDQAIKGATQVFVETPEQARLYELCLSVCELCNEIQAMQTKPSLMIPEPLNLFMYKDVFGRRRETIINPTNLINYFKLL